MSLPGYKKKTRPALWKQMQDEADEADGTAAKRERQRRDEQHEKRMAANRAATKRRFDKLRNKPKRQRAISPVRKARAGELRAYRRRVPHYLAENPHCIACPRMVGLAAVVDSKPHSSESVHHKRGRLGPLLLDERYWIPTCNHAHDFIHRNIVIARALDLIAQPGQWNRPD